LVLVAWGVGPRVAAPPPFFTLASLQGQVFVDGRPSVAGQALAVGQHLRVETGVACLTVNTGGQMCLSENTEVAPWVVVGPERTLHLVRGVVKVTMGHQPEGQRVGIHTDHGSVLAIGTVFQVARSHEVEVQVFEGRVLTRAAKQEEELGPGAPRILGPEGLVSLATTPVEPQPLTAVAEEPDVPLPKSPPSVKPHKTISPKLPAAPLPAVDSSDMLRSARLLRSEGRTAEAATLLEQVIRKARHSQEAEAALLALSDLELGPLRRPARALVHARTYLEGQGPLRDEAAYREIRALDALGRTTDAARKRAQFLVEFPQSPLIDAISPRPKPEK
jgi:hypothetical protein